MGIEIEAVNDDGSMPRGTRMTLICDSDHGFFRHMDVFEHDDGFIAQMSMAMRAGWKDTFRNGQRTILCPECSGKVPQSTAIESE